MLRVRMLAAIAMLASISVLPGIAMSSVIHVLPGVFVLGIMLPGVFVLGIMLSTKTPGRDRKSTRLNSSHT